jgi:putative membrane protein
MRRLAIGAALAATPAIASAHAGGVATAPAWSFEPWLLAPLTLSAALYAFGWLRLSKRAAGGRSGLHRSALFFASGWVFLAAATVSPLHEAGERSFTLHMIEHEVLMLVAAPLLVLSRPLGAMLWAFPAAWRKALGVAGRSRLLHRGWVSLSEPVTATLVQAAALWLWHAPALFDLALAHEGWHIVQHLSFFISALFFWQAMFRRNAGLFLQALCLFSTSVVAGALGALMAFSQSPWYARYALLGMAPFGLSPVEDQQMAGLLMWIPGGLVHAGAALAIIAGALAKGGLRQEPRPCVSTRRQGNNRQALTNRR